MKGTGLALLGLGIGALALAASAASRSPVPSGGANLTDEEKGRVQAALMALRALTTAAPKDRKNLILAFQHAARIPKSGTLDPLTMQAVEATVNGQVDGDAILEGVKSLLPPSVVPPNAPVPPEHAEPAQPASEPAQRALAEALAKSIEAKGAAYERELARGFQRAVGLNPDGIYGPKTRAALIANGIAASRLPEKLEVSRGQLAELVTRNLALAGPAKADKGLLSRFQQAAGLNPDGLYGPKTKAALIASGIDAARLPKEG